MNAKTWILFMTTMVAILVLKDFKLLIRTMDNKIVKQFVVHTDNALIKIVDLVNEPESPVISKWMGINILKFD